MAGTTDGPAGDGGPHAFVADLEAPELEPADQHHLARVVRLRPGDPLTVSDGAGRWRACRFADGPLPLDGPVRVVAPPAPVLTVAFALVKGQKPELVTQKLTELGIDEIRPFVAARSVVRWEPAKAAAATERLQRVADQAAMQCRRVWLARVHPPVAFAEVASLPGAVLAERDGDPLGSGQVTVLVGPEGGWAPTELATGLPRVALGGHVLRAETAALAAAVLLSARRAEILPRVPHAR